MDKASVIGTVLGVVSLVWVSWLASKGDLMIFWSVEGVISVIGGSIGAAFMAIPLEKIVKVPGYMKAFTFYKAKSPAQMVELFGRLSEKARRDGILALESEIEALDDRFLAAGLKAAVDGVDPGAVEANLRMEILAMQDRHKSAKKLFDSIKTYGPAWGLIGTLLGQIGMFGSLGGSIELMGEMLALSVVGTLYGAIVANVFAGPMGDKLALRSGEEILSREMMIQGILSIQAGDNPRVTTDRLLAFIPAAARVKLQAAA
ncbi:MAG: MotA/TolQ/ExbB proton channel family protein [Phycisphaerales bacterium]